jgi:hypothetical protein
MLYMHMYNFHFTLGLVSTASWISFRVHFLNIMGLAPR